jgi:phosphoglycerate dehydrogenase-like enzyme
LIKLLVPFGVEILAVTRRGHDVPGARATYPAEALPELWSVPDYLALAAPATPVTRQLVGSVQLEHMRSDAWLIKIARGSLVDTDALVEALRAGTIAGAALDVTDPEPLPPRHPLWALPTAIVTPHAALPRAVELRRIADRVRENVARFATREPLIGAIDGAGGY